MRRDGLAQTNGKDARGQGRDGGVAIMERLAQQVVGAFDLADSRQHGDARIAHGHDPAGGQAVEGRHELR